MPRDRNAPSLALTTVTVVLLTVGWGYVRLDLFGDEILPLTFVVPLLVCVWTRRAWQLWGMAVVFCAMAIWKVVGLMPARESAPEWDGGLFLFATLFNVVAGALVIQMIMALRSRLDDRNARLQAQNAELEAQAEELAQQNEEIKVQAEELAQQNEEIESQSEELAGQNEELQAINERLGVREDILQSLLESSRSPESGLATLREVCRRSLPALGQPAECVAILRRDADAFRVKVEASSATDLTFPEEWPLEGSIAQIVLQTEKTAYVSDLGKQPELAAPFAPSHRVRSVLATPLRVAGMPYGALVVGSTQPGHWTQEQFRIAEWLAAQSGLITEAVRWQRALTERTREMAAANQAKDQFLAMLSHELRTPLTPVLAAAGELENDERVPEDVREDLRMIRRNISIQSRLVDDLLDLTRLGRGKLELDTRSLDFSRLLEETVAIVGPDLDAKDQSIDLQLDGADGCRVNGDGPRLQQVFWNLLKNAVKFSEPKSCIRIAARMVPGAPARVAVDVIDMGVGIETNNVDRIFLPFEQVTADRQTKAGGLGLGLAIAKAIVELHEGTIRVSSAGIGRGATFTVELPVADEGSAAARPSASRAPMEKPGCTERPMHILLVEDHGDTGRVLARLLRNAGYAVEHAETAAGALALFQHRPFDLLISDIGLPDETGIELMRRLRKLQPDLRGICLSGYGMENDQQACREAGFLEHLTKPVDMQRLHAAIARVGSAGGEQRLADGSRANESE